MHSLYFEPDGTLSVHIEYEQEFALKQFIKIIDDNSVLIPPALHIHRDDGTIESFALYHRRA
jgi:hypothetical protein